MKQHDDKAILITSHWIFSQMSHSISAFLVTLDELLYENAELKLKHHLTAFPD